MTPGPPLETLGALAVDLAEAGGQVLLAWRQTLVEGGSLSVRTKGTDTDPVTAADTACEERLVALLTEQRPDDGLLGEEGADRPSRTGLRWVLDPLDGTVNYLYGVPAWSVSVAVEQQTDDGWIAIAGAVHDPVVGETHRAIRGGGAWVGPRRLMVNDPVDAPMALVATGFSYDADRRTAQGRTVAGLLPQVRDIRRFGSAALDLCRVASGQVDAYYEVGLGRWDLAAGALIAQEAGAVVSMAGVGAGPFEVLAAGPALHPVLTDLLGA